jgi:hypothetical protein
MTILGVIWCANKFTAAGICRRGRDAHEMLIPSSMNFGGTVSTARVLIMRAPILYAPGGKR